MDKLKMHSPDLTAQNIEKIAELFPGCVTEAHDAAGKLRLAIDFDQLRQELSDHIVEGPQERYHLNWPGKREALLTANVPIAKTLRPCREESVDFDTTQNLFIEGDNLEALKLLQETYLGKVKMIYIDPPYNTGRDFVYSDSFSENISDYLAKSSQKDNFDNRLHANPENSGRYHSNWISMMYARLKIARQLLSEDGILFISIDDIEVDNIKKIALEIFGEGNFIGCAGRITKKSNNKGDHWAPNFDYILTVCKNSQFAEPFFGGVNLEAYDQVDTEGPRAGEPYQLVRLYMSTIQNRNPDQRYWIDCPDGTKIIPPGTTLPPERPNLGDGIWRWSKPTFEQNRDRIVVKRVRSSNLISDTGEPAEWNVFTKTYLADVIKNSSAKPNSFIEGYINQQGSHELRELDIPFSYSKPSSLIKYFCEITRLKPNDIVLDFFAGSGTTHHAVTAFNAETGNSVRTILIQLDEKIGVEQEAYKHGFSLITELSKERLRRSGAKIKSTAHKESWNKDVGFRVLKIDSSNMADTYYRPDETSQSDLLARADNIKEGRDNPEDLLFQVMLDWAVDLTLPIRRETILGKTVYFVSAAPYDLMACFDDSIGEDLIKELASHAPLRMVFKDTGFATDAAKINAVQIFKQMSEQTDVKAI